MNISIYQLNQENNKFYRESFDEIVNQIGSKPTEQMYRKIYTGKIKDDATLEDIFSILQNQMPDDFIGHTFGVSDVIKIETNGDKLKAGNYYFCDNIGWEKLNWDKKENLHEAIQSNNLFFSTSDDFKADDGMRKAEEGNHFWLTLKDAQNTLKQLNHNKVYSIYSSDLKKPLIIDEDIILWNGKNLSDLLLCKLDDIPYDIWQDGKDLIYPEQIHIDNLTEKDRNTLKRIDDIDDVFRFIRQKGFDHIRYKNTQENNSDSVILNHDSNFDYSTLSEM